MVRMAGSYGRCNWSETPEGSQSSEGTPNCSAGSPSLPYSPQGHRTQLKLSLPYETLSQPTLPPLQPSPHPRSPYLGTLPLQPSSLMHTAPSTELCHSQIPAAPSTSAHRRLPPYPASRCLAHRGSPTALVLKQRKEGEIRLDTQLCRGRMNVGFF